MTSRLLSFGLGIFLSLFAMGAAYASMLTANVATATVFIANFDDQDRLIGWGSGFFVDEGIVVTNKHVIEGSAWYRVFATHETEAVDEECFKKINKGDVKINLDDDVAYMRVYLPCEHGVMDFADDPWAGDPVSVIGFPYRGSLEASKKLKVTTGSVIGNMTNGWLFTDAHLDFGNSGGPVVNDTGVLGVAVAKGEDEQGNYVVGYFIPSSVILKGLLYANDSRFGYMPRSRASASRRSSVSSVSSVSSSSMRSADSSSRSSASRASSSRLTRYRSPLEIRTCERVDRQFRGNKVMLDRVNARLLKRFGFMCRV